MESTYKNYIGAEVRGYKIDEFVGRGRYGMVFRAHDSRNHTVAIKIIELPTDELMKEYENSYGSSMSGLDDFVSEIARKFRTETESMMRLSDNDNCESIIKYIAQNATKKDIYWRIYIVMEFAAPLKQYMAARPLTVGDAIDLGIDIATGLKTCHEYKIIHRDIKEDNLFYGKNGHFKIGDFGVANMSDATKGITQGVGSEYYMAPEVKKGEQYNGTADIYSLGLVLYKLFNFGRYPFAPTSEQKTISISDNTDAYNLRMSGRKVPKPEFAPDELAPVIQKACEYSRNERYTNDEDLIYDLTEAKRRIPNNVLESQLPSPPILTSSSNFDYLKWLNDVIEETSKSGSEDPGTETTPIPWPDDPPVPEPEDDPPPEEDPGAKTNDIIQRLGVESQAAKKLMEKIALAEDEKMKNLEKQRKIKKRNIWIGIAAGVAALLALAIVLIWPQTIEYRAEKADEYAIHKYQFGIDRGRIQKNDDEVIGAYYLDTNDKDWLYFSEKEDELVPLGTIQESPLYKIKRNGTQLTKISDKHCEYDVYYDGWIYFVSYYEDRALCRVTSDGQYDPGTEPEGVILSDQPVASLKMIEQGILELRFDDGTEQKYDVKNAKDDYTKIIEVVE